MKLLESHKPSGTYVKVRFFKPWRVGPGKKEWMPGDDMVCNDLLADHLAAEMIAFPMFEAEKAGLKIFVPGQIN